jgi:asparagine synthase (glutamine-hydrolysing)
VTAKCTGVFTPVSAAHLRERLANTIDENSADWLLFSGGVDTAILAAVLARLKSAKEINAVTVTLESTGEDLKYARLVAGTLGFRHHHLPVTTREAIAAIPLIIKTLGSFDPALPNDIVVYFAARYCRTQGGDVVMTGDGADELFAGYDFMREMSFEEAAAYISRIAPRMSFSSNILGPSLGLRVVQPFLDPELIAFALDMPLDLKIREEGGRIFGKWAIRKAFEDLLTREVAWQEKRPLEYGSGMTGLRKTIASGVSDDEYNHHPYPVKFINKEHYYYYKVYRDVVGAIPEPTGEEKACPACGGGMRRDAFHCRICGNVLDWRNG